MAEAANQSSPRPAMPEWIRVDQRPGTTRPHPSPQPFPTELPGKECFSSLHLCCKNGGDAVSPTHTLYCCGCPLRSGRGRWLLAGPGADRGCLLQAVDRPQSTTVDRRQKPGSSTPGAHLSGVTCAPNLLSVGQAKAGCHLRPRPQSPFPPGPWHLPGFV